MDYMEKYKEEFINFMVDSNVLKFGDFTLKSEKQSSNNHNQYLNITKSGKFYRHKFV